MGFKIKMAEVSSDELKKIRDDRPTGGYDGPTPPPGKYEAKVAKVWFAETKNGKPAVKVSFVFENDGENEVYNGASTIQNYMIPVDPSERAFPVQVAQIDTLFAAISGGTFGYREFQDAVTSGKTDADQQKKDKIGIPVTQIGKLKISGEDKVTIKTKIREYNGKEYIDVHYIVRDTPKATESSSTDDIDLGGDDDDLDDWLDD